MVSNVRTISETVPLAPVSKDSISLPTSKSLAASTVNHLLSGSYSNATPWTGPTLVSDLRVSLALKMLGLKTGANCGKFLDWTNTPEDKASK